MAAWSSFMSCFSGCYSGRRRNNTSNFGQRMRQHLPSAARLDARFRRMVLRRQRAEEPVLDLPEPGHQFRSGVLKYLPPSNRLYDPKFEGTALKTTVVDRRPSDKDNDGNVATRFRKMFARERPLENLELEALRKEEKAMKKYLKEKNLYRRDMTYEQMKDLKFYIEFYVEKTKDTQQKENELNTAETTTDPAATRITYAAPLTNTVEVVEPKTSDSPEKPPEDAADKEPNESCIEPPEPDHPTALRALLRPEGPLEETDGNQIHPGTGLPVSAPIYIPGTYFIWPVDPIEVEHENMLVEVIPGDIPCIKCNPEAVFLREIVKEEHEVSVHGSNEDHGVSVPAQNKEQVLSQASGGKAIRVPDQIFSPRMGHLSPDVAWVNGSSSPRIVAKELESVERKRVFPSTEIKYPAFTAMEVSYPLPPTITTVAEIHAEPKADPLKQNEDVGPPRTRAKRDSRIVWEDVEKIEIYPVGNDRRSQSERPIRRRAKRRYRCWPPTI